ncbi:MAG: nucleotidyltransferase domain-containing protein, partial [Anaerolineales bacterium]
LTPKDRAALAEYIAAIQDRFPERILDVILFGSKARGDADAESDIDLLVVVDVQNIEDRGFSEVRSELWRIASEVSLRHDVVISSRVFDQGRWAKAKRMRLPLYRAIVADGISLLPEPLAM